MFEAFWMVVGKGVPVVRHSSLSKAKDEAERLARQDPGQEFVVLESVARCVKSDIRWENADQMTASQSLTPPF